LHIVRGKGSMVRADQTSVSDCFMYENELHMRTKPDFMSEADLRTWPIRVVRLSDGHVNGLCADMMVRPVTATCTYDE
jgi:hypothetical protein